MIHVERKEQQYLAPSETWCGLPAGAVNDRRDLVTIENVIRTATNLAAHDLRRVLCPRCTTNLVEALQRTLDQLVPIPAAPAEVDAAPTTPVSENATPCPNAIPIEPMEGGARVLASPPGVVRRPDTIGSFVLSFASQLDAMANDQTRRGDPARATALRAVARAAEIASGTATSLDRNEFLSMSLQQLLVKLGLAASLRAARGAIVSSEVAVDGYLIEEPEAWCSSFQWKDGDHSFVVRCGEQTATIQVRAG